MCIRDRSIGSSVRRFNSEPSEAGKAKALSALDFRHFHDAVAPSSTILSVFLRLLVEAGRVNSRPFCVGQLPAEGNLAQ